MRIGLIDVNGHRWPNLCLMKLSAYHKGRGDTVEWHRESRRYDLVYMSRVFMRKKGQLPDDKETQPDLSQ